MPRDLHNHIKASYAFAPLAAQTNSDTARVSTILDTQGFEANELLLINGTNTDADATFAVLLEEGDNSALSDNAAVADADLIGTEAGASFTFAADNKCIKLGYKGTKRYIRATVTPTGNNSGNWFMAGAWLQGHPRSLPQTSQQV
jgi:hypothetical protein